MTCRALVQAMGETLWRAGGKRKAVVAFLDISELQCEHGSNEQEQDEVYYRHFVSHLYYRSLLAILSEVLANLYLTERSP